MKIHRLVVGALSTNCYILEDEESKAAIIIDPGEEPGKIAAYVEQYALEIRYILITHGHMDHMRGASALTALYECPVVIHADEIEYMQSAIVKRSPYSAKAFEKFLAVARKGLLIHEGAVIQAEALQLKAIEVPGHTSHSLCFYMEKEGELWAGDTLFCGGVGRTDFYEGGSWDLLVNIQEKLMVLPDPVRVWPGHGPETTIGDERSKNPYLLMLSR